MAGWRKVQIQATFETRLAYKEGRIALPMESTFEQVTSLRFQS